MTEQALFLKLLDYNEYATERILNGAAKLTAEQFQAPTGQSHGNLQVLLIHTLRTEWLWRTLSSQSQIGELPIFSIEHFPDVASLKKAWVEEDQQMRDYLESMDDDRLDAPVQVTQRDGNVAPMIPWQMLMHRFLHSMQHRSEAAVILTGYGYSPGDLDFIFFI